MRTVTDAERRARIGMRHALASPVSGPEEATRAVVCLHATEPANVYLSAFARSRASQADIADALYGRRTLVRQLGMRRTVFALPTELLPAVRGSASARVAAQVGTRLAKEVELAGIARDGKQWLARVLDDTREAIRGQPSTTAQLRTRVPGLDVRIAQPGQPGADTPIAPRLLTVLAADGSVVRGANEGGWRLSRPVWTAVEQWLGTDPGTLDERSGYRELLQKWLWSFGPATENDIVWWLGATKACVRRALQDVGAVAVELEDGTPAWLSADDTEPLECNEDWTALLPPLDPTTMGWQRRDFYLAEHGTSIFDRNGNGGQTAWWNGRIIGSWTQRSDGSVFVVPVAPLPGSAEAALAAQAEELTNWLDGDVVRSVYAAPVVRALGPV